MNDMSVSASEAVEMKCSDIRYVKELYPRIKPNDEIIERYRSAIDNLPPVIVARDGILVDGYHRWQAHVREGSETVGAIDLGNLSDAEIVRESISRNATHGEQLSQQDKKRLAGQLWNAFAGMDHPERVTEVAAMLSVREQTIYNWTKDERQEEKRAIKERAWDMWLDCWSQCDIAEELEVDQKTVSNWLGKFQNSEKFLAPPGVSKDKPNGNIQHFDVWQFQTSNKDAGAQSYFGALPPQVMENLLWFYTDVGDIVVDPFAGSGTTVEVGKGMGRRVWASDIRGDHYSPHLSIHRHDILSGWPENAPTRDVALVFLDPPYWKQQFKSE